MDWLKFLGVFALVTFLDFAWAQYIKHTATGNPLRSATYATLIYLLGCMVTIAYVGDHKMIVAAGLGSFVGTYLSVAFGKRNADA